MKKPGTDLVARAFPTGLMDPIAVNQLTEVVRNLTSIQSRALRRLEGETGDPRRSINAECGYPTDLDAEMYYELQDREPLAKRVNQLWPRECWKVAPEIIENDDVNVITPFEAFIHGLGRQLVGEQSWYEGEEGDPFWKIMEEGDEDMGIGQFGAMLIGYDDVQSIDDYARPVLGVSEKNSVPGQEKPASSKRFRFDNEMAQGAGRYRFTGNQRRHGRSHSLWSLARRGGIVVNRDGDIELTERGREIMAEDVEVEEGTVRRVMFMRTFDETCASINRWETNPSSDRYGRPAQYLITVNDQRRIESQSAPMPQGQLLVHWTRVVHLCENSSLFHESRLHTPYNNLYNVRKITGADSETYWRNCVLKIFLEQLPEWGDAQVDYQSLKDQFEEMSEGLKQFMVLQGVQAKAIPPAISDPTPHIKANIDQICTLIEVPVPVFMGYEIGQQASTNNQANWDKRVAGRQNKVCTPRIIRPVIDRLILVGAAPAPKSWKCVWPEIDSSTEQDRAGTALVWTQALAAYIAGNLSNFINPLDYLTRVWKLPQAEVESVLKNTIEWQDEQQARTDEGQPAIGAPPAPEPPNGDGEEVEDKEEVEEEATAR